MKITMDINVTDNNFGIKQEDKWCLINLQVDNEELKYNIEKELLTLNEITTTINILEDFLCNKIKQKRITYIKNYLKIKLLTLKKEKYLELTIIESKDISNKTYKITLNETEIIELLNNLKKVL
jgi:hypothetical protein